MSATEHTVPLSRLSRVAAAHPVRTYLVVSFAAAWGVLFPLTLNGLPPEPGLLVVVFLGMVAPACLITAAEGGRPAVRELLSRTFRWRVDPVWYLLAAFGLPIAVVAGAVAVRGPGVLPYIASHPALIASYLAGFAVVPLINLWEETGWMGFVQARLESRFGALRAAVITAFFFAALHLPLFFVDGVGNVAVAVLLTLGFAVPFRIVLGWLYHHARSSVLVVAVAHASFNAINDGPLTLAMWPHAWPTTVAPVVLGVAGLLVVTCSRGAYRLRIRARGLHGAVNDGATRRTHSGRDVQTS